MLGSSNRNVEIMTNIIKSLIAKTRKSNTRADNEALQRANAALQFRAQQIVRLARPAATAINN